MARPGRAVAVLALAASVAFAVAIVASNPFMRLPWLGVALFSRIRRDDVLEHDTRRRILETVSVRPGLTLQGLQATLGVAWGTVVHHVHLLERHGRLVSVRQGPRRLLYVALTPEARAREHLALLRTATAQGIARAVHGRPGIQQVEVCRLLGVRSPSASKHLARLALAGLVVVDRSARGCRYAPTPQLQEALALCHAGVRRPPRPSARAAHPTAVVPPAD
ncbi:MAG: helix-turn-helix domain-containing protein [Halobacteriales archaeon]|nr:helix-turn-helix domain-containing protein [Halobacteriales archaeon]